jgi:hypothetical protein
MPRSFWTRRSQQGRRRCEDQATGRGSGPGAQAPLGCAPEPATVRANRTIRGGVSPCCNSEITTDGRRMHRSALRTPWLWIPMPSRARSCPIITRRLMRQPRAPAWPRCTSRRACSPSRAPRCRRALLQALCLSPAQLPRAGRAEHHGEAERAAVQPAQGARRARKASPLLPHLALRRPPAWTRSPPPAAASWCLSPASSLCGPASGANTARRSYAPLRTRAQPEGESRSTKYSQVFHLMPAGTSWFVFNDSAFTGPPAFSASLFLRLSAVFRLNYG